MLAASEKELGGAETIRARDVPPFVEYCLGIRSRFVALAKNVLDRFYPSFGKTVTFGVVRCG